MISNKSGLEVFQNGKFSLTLFNDSLSKGLREKASNVRNSDGMEKSTMMGKDEVLQSLDTLTRTATDVLEVSFPYPQIYILSDFIILLSATKIYEWDGSSWTLKLTTTTGNLWQVVDFIKYLYLSNDTVAVVRDSLTQAYTVTTSLPSVNAMCNYNGQVIIGGL